MTYRYATSGTCSLLIEIDIDDNKISDIRFVGGCHGNLQGISALTKGMNIDEVIDRLRGIRCGNKTTSCPDQLALALEEIKRQ